MLRVIWELQSLWFQFCRAGRLIFTLTGKKWTVAILQCDAVKIVSAAALSMGGEVSVFVVLGSVCLLLSIGSLGCLFWG